jgi:O-antigen ligase
MSSKIGVRSGIGTPLVTLCAALVAGLLLGWILETSPRVPFLAVGGLLVLLLLTRRPRFALSCLAPVLALNVGVIGTLTLKVVLAGVVALVWIAGLMRNRWRLNPIGHGLLAALALIVVTSLYASSGPGFEARRSDLYGLLAGLAFCAAAMSIGLIPRVFLRSAAYGIGLIALLYEVGALGETDAAIWGSRASALELNPNYLGVMFATGVIAGAALLRGHVRGHERLLAIGVVGVSTAAMFATQSRGALFVTAVGLAVLLIAVIRSRMIVGLLILGLVVVVSVTATARTDIRDAALGDRGTADFTVSDTFRGEARSLALRYTAEHPLDGVGYGLFSDRALQDGEQHIPLSTHNDYLRLSAEAGFPALLAFLLVLLPALRPSRLRAVDVGLRALLLAQAVSLLIGNLMSNVQVSGPLWLILGYMWWRSRQHGEVEHGSAEERVPEWTPA